VSLLRWIPKEDENKQCNNVRTPPVMWTIMFGGHVLIILRCILDTEIRTVRTLAKKTPIQQDIGTNRTPYSFCSAEKSTLHSGLMR